MGNNNTLISDVSLTFHPLVSKKEESVRNFKWSFLTKNELEKSVTFKINIFKT